MTLKQQAVLGFEWSASAQIAKQVLRFIISVVLARLLTPKDFGLIGMVVVFTGFAGIIGEMGFGAAIVQKKEVRESHLSSIFWLNIAIGFLLAGLLVATAPLISRFYNEPKLKLLAMFVSITLLVNAFSSVRTAILRRLMEFRKLAIIETATMVIAGVLAITLAFLGFGVWSLVWHTIATAAVTAVMLWKFTEWSPRLQFDNKAIKELLGFSINLLGSNLFNYWSRNSDNLLIGKFIGSSGLGVYTRAYQVMLLPLNQISITLGKVMFPSLAKIRDDKVLTKRIYLKTIGAIALVTLPMMAGLFVVADSFVLALLGSKWVDVIPVLRVLSLVGMIQSIVTTVGWIYNSQGRTDLMFRWGIAAGTVGILSFIVGIWIGSVKAVAYCYAAANVLLLYHNFTIPGKLISMSFHEVISSISGALGCAVVMGVGVWLLGLALPSASSEWSKLVIQVPFGIILYILMIHFLKLKPYIQVREVFQEELANHFARIKQP